MEALAKLGIDGWALLLYLVNFGILLIAMKRWVYKPLVAKLDERRETIHHDVQAARKMREDLERERAQEEETRKVRETELDDRIRNVKQTVRDDAKQMLIQAEEQRDAILAQASKAADERIASAIDDAEGEIIQRINKVVKHVLQDAVSQQELEKSVEASWERVSDLS